MGSGCLEILPQGRARLIDLQQLMENIVEECESRSGKSSIE